MAWRGWRRKSDKMPLQRRSTNAGNTSAAAAVTLPRRLIPFSPSPPPLSPFLSPCSGARDATDPWEVRKSHGRMRKPPACLVQKFFPFLLVQFSAPPEVMVLRSEGISHLPPHSSAMMCHLGSRRRFGFSDPPRPLSHMDAM